jgi:exopolysaccharide biosynthesis polyprenyl glycosylphosphotransferase
MFNLSKRIINALLLSLCDVGALLGAFLAAYHLRTRFEIFVQVQPINEYVLPLMALIGIIVLMFYKQGLYRDIRDLSMIEEYANIIKALTYAFLIALALTFFLKLYEQSRVLVFIFWSTALILLIVVRFVYYTILKQLRARGWNRLRVAVVGSDKKVRAVGQLLKQYPQLGYYVAAKVILPRDVSPRSDNLRKKIDHEILSRYQRGEIESVIISDTVKNYHHIMEVHELFNEYRIPHRNITEAFDLAGFKAPSGEGLEGLVNSLDEGQTSGGYKVLKRFIDEVVSLSILFITSPLWLLIMLAITLSSPGSIFFRQERVGYHGRKFLIYKFRSMRVDAPQYAKTPRGKGDPRITKVGAFLRRTSLDELPQLINVIKGDMSLVGPRPEMPFLVEKYKPIYRCRLLVLPGLTGLWQVSGRTNKPLEENIKYDLYYIKNQSLLLDLVILLRTIPTVLFGKGAY